MLYVTSPDWLQVWLAVVEIALAILAIYLAVNASKRS